MTRSRFILALFIAAGAAVIVLLVPRIEGEPVSLAPEPVTEDAQEPEVPWPSPPSASPLTSEAPLIVVAPTEPLAAFVFNAVNAHRTSAGLAVVLTDETLTAMAQLHASDMARRSYLDHITPEGVTFEMRIDASGYAYRGAAENLGFASHVELIVPDWMRSPPHRENIENTAYRRVGVAAAWGKWQGTDVIYAAMVFANPK